MEGSERDAWVTTEKPSRDAEAMENVMLLFSTSQPQIVSQSGAISDTSGQTLLIHSKRKATAGMLPASHRPRQESDQLSCRDDCSETRRSLRLGQQR
jgi:hypothetical protein